MIGTNQQWRVYAWQRGLKSKYFMQIKLLYKNCCADMLKMKVWVIQHHIQPVGKGLITWCQNIQWIDIAMKISCNYSSIDQQRYFKMLMGKIQQTTGGRTNPCTPIGYMVILPYLYLRMRYKGIRWNRESCNRVKQTKWFKATELGVLLKHQDHYC